MFTTTLLLLACSGKDLPPPPDYDPNVTDDGTETGEPETGQTETGADGADSDTSPPEETGPSEDTVLSTVLICPLEMSAVTGADDEVLYCIDTWEVWVDDPTLMGSVDQYSAGATPPTTTASSLEGIRPTTVVSFGQAASLCANTPVIDGAGEAVGYKHLATVDEWRDAADGTVGEGGSAYPYGDDFDEDACACFAEDGSPIYSESVPSGSLPDCVSDFGVYDQSGNVWEWADPERTFDIDAWWPLAAPYGLEDDGGYLTTTAPTLAKEVFIIAAGVPSALERAEGGGLKVELTVSSWDYRSSPLIGHIVLAGEDRYDMLPIEAEPIDPSADVTDARIKILYERDGHPIAEKVGGAYYVPFCSVNGDGDLSHHHAANGTIGFRCASPPIAE